MPCGNIGAYAAIMRETDAGPMIHTLKSGQAPDYVPPLAQRMGRDYTTIYRDPIRQQPRRAWIVNQYVEQGGGCQQKRNGVT